jgi:hypothetical protein
MSGLTNTWGELLYKNVAAGAQAAVNTTETQLNLNATMGAQPLIPGGFFLSAPNTIGKALRVIARGVITTTSGPPTFGLLVRANTAASSITGNVWLGTSSTVTATASLTGAYWELEGTITVTTSAAGANSVVRGVGRLLSAAVASANNPAPAWGAQASPGTTSAFDLTVPYYLSLSYVSSSASNSCSLNELEVYGLN